MPEITVNIPEHVWGQLREAIAPPTPAPTEQVGHEYLTELDAAEYLKCGRSTVRNWVADGHLRRYTFGRVVRYKRADLDALLDGETPAE